MNKNFTFWMNKLNKSEQTICDECLRTLQLVVDGEATKEEEEVFNKHLEECMPCYNFFQVEKSVKQILQHKIEKKIVPASVIENIKSKIRSIS